MGSHEDQRAALDPIGLDEPPADETVAPPPDQAYGKTAPRDERGQWLGRDGTNQEHLRLDRFGDPIDFHPSLHRDQAKVQSDWDPLWDAEGDTPEARRRAEREAKARRAPKPKPVKKTRRQRMFNEEHDGQHLQP